MRDERSLLELSKRVEAAATDTAVPADPTRAASERLLTLSLADGAALPLGLGSGMGEMSGAYGILRGVPRNARLSHGISVGGDSWLIDGVDLSAASLDMRTGEPGLVELELALLSRDSRVIGIERIAIAVSAARPVAETDAAPAPSAVDAPVEVVRPATPAAPVATPAPAARAAAAAETAARPVAAAPAAPAAPEPPAEIVSPVVAEADTAPPAPADAPARSEVAVVAAPMATTAEPKPERAVAPAQAPPPKLAIPRDTTLVPGRGSLLRLEVEAPSGLADGAFVVLRGLPGETALSNGVSIGDGIWLLTLAELADLEVRLPAKAQAGFELDARLVSNDGRLLAGDSMRITQEVVSRAPSAPAVSEPAPAVPATPINSPAAKAPALPTAAAPERVAAVTPATDAAAVATRSPPAVVRPAAPSKGIPAKDDNVALSRARRMLDLGNFAVARPLLERAAREGSGEAAFLLGATFDAEWLRGRGALGIVGDAAKAKSWYDEARRLRGADADRPSLPARPTP